jgi:hypothetical protein
MATYSTLFNQQFGSSNEPINAMQILTSVKTSRSMALTISKSRSA